jgi:hypothetical protein
MPHCTATQHNNKILKWEKIKEIKSCFKNYTEDELASEHYASRRCH